MKFHDIINSRFGTILALWVGRSLPQRQGYWIAHQLGTVYGRSRRFAQTKAVRANQWVIHGGKLSKEELDRQTVATFRNGGRFLYDFYHNLRNPEVLLNMTEFEPSFLRYLDRCDKEPQLMVCPHVTNADLIGRAAALSGLKMQILSYPQPPGGYRLTNRIRAEAGMDITPMSVTALRQATIRLQNNGTVLTGIDRPVQGSKYTPRFFGRPAALPVAHVRLALKLGIPVIVISGYLHPDGKYVVWASDPVAMRPDPDLQTETVRNAEAILDVVAEAIRKVPDQWVMYYPLWPEALQEIP
ncbi:MAG TPA: lysophospholipid acyltransferase family protein [Levilinea sp.]|nr:lysophospholipid acyltransferase family protein [Levilinea sp.]